MRARRRDNRDMILLGGWLFADLLLGLAMLFLTANTVGTPAPTPTPSPLPDYQATELAAALATSEAQQDELAGLEATATAADAQTMATAAAQATERAELAAQATRRALLEAQSTAQAEEMATMAALSEEERATAEALATEDALAAEATIAAFATQQALAEENIDDAARNLATAAAQATQDAESAQATISAQQTQAAEVAAIATENAESGANALATAQAGQAAAEATIAAILANQSSSESELATAQAEVNAAQATVQALVTQQAAAMATTTALAGQAASGSIDPTLVELSIEVDAQGLLDGDQDAIEETSEILAEELDQYEGCRVGLTLTFGWSSDLTTGLAVADAVNSILVDDFPEIFGEAAIDNFAALQDPVGRVDLQIYFYRGCEALQ